MDEHGQARTNTDRVVRGYGISQGPPPCGEDVAFALPFCSGFLEFLESVLIFHPARLYDHPGMAEFKNQFSWSFTRHKNFHECRRRYYYHYYGSWNGWSNDAPDQARLAYRLKCMQSLPMWLGDLVHRMIERVLGDLRNQEVNTVEKYQKQLRGWMNKEYAQSTEKKWMWKPKYNLNLFEHYYGEEISAEQRAAARDKVYGCLQHFLQSAVFTRLGKLRPTEWKTIEKLEQFEVGGQTVFLKIDCATQAGGLTTIYDWKTGAQADDTAAQLACYALYACHAWRVPVESQRLVSYYLDPDTVRERVPTAEELIDTKEFILASMREMIGALDGGVEKNRATMENFPMTDARGQCRRCFFREMCYGTREWKEAPAAQAQPGASG